MLLQHAQQRPGKPAFREKDLGIWPDLAPESTMSGTQIYRFLLQSLSWGPAQREEIAHRKKGEASKRFRMSRNCAAR